MADLPRLLYVGDVPVEASYHGSALLYRLLDDYPPDRLVIVEAGDLVSEASRRLRGPRYHRVELPSTRLASLRSTRFARTSAAFQALLADRFLSRLNDVARAFDPEAILTVAHGYTWLSALALSRRLRIPMHLVIHDDPRHSIAVASAARSWLENRFADAYRHASSRLCVSPAMAEEYERRYGVKGSVLYPSQGATSVARDFKRDPDPSGFALGYAGSIEVGDYRRALKVAAESLRAIGGRLLLYGPISAEQLRGCGLDLPNVVLRGYVANAEVIDTLRREVDALFLPMSFEAAQEVATTLCFPSKLADYTAATLPLLIRGPAYSSAVRWAAEHPGVAEVISNQSDDELRAALQRFRDEQYRSRLAAKASSVGREMFARDVVRGQFHAELLRA